MCARENDGVDPVASGCVEHRLGGGTDCVQSDLLSGELGLGQLDQFGRAVADDGAVGSELRGEVIDVGLPDGRGPHPLSAQKSFAFGETEDVLQLPPPPGELGDLVLKKRVLDAEGVVPQGGVVTYEIRLENRGGTGTPRFHGDRQGRGTGRPGPGTRSGRSTTVPGQRDRPVG